jgi:superfamily II DNA or RNA helicase
MRYSLQDLQALFPADILDDAAYRLELGQVALPDVRQDGRLITSLVQVPEHRPYRVYVRIDLNPDDSPHIHSECSCGSRGDCHHVAAVLLRALAEEQALSGDELQFARQAGLPSAPGPEHYHSDIKQRLLYLLFPESGTQDALAVQTVSARLRKEGGFGRLVDYLPAWVSRGRPPRFILQQDRQILAELERLKGDDAEMTLQGIRGGQLLSRILETGRCWLGEAVVPLRTGKPRPAAFRWEMDEFGIQYPQFEIEPQAPIRLLLDGPWYIDPASAECGRLHIDLAGPLLERLFRLSEGISPEEVPRLHRSLAEMADGSKLPPLRQLEVELCRGIEPVPCLRLFSCLQEMPWGDELWLDQAQLSFAYGERRLLHDQAAQWFEGDRLIRIERDKKTEQSVTELLLDWGFESVDPFFAEPACYTLETGQEAWLDFQTELLPRLRQAGWHIEFDDDFRFRLVAVEHWYGSLQPKEEADWFRLGLGIQVEGQRINLLPALVGLLREFPNTFTRKQLQQTDPQQMLVLALEDRRLVPVPFERVRLILETLFELYQERSLDTEGQLSLSRIQLARLAELFEADPSLQLHGTDSAVLQELIQTLRGNDRLPVVTSPPGLQARLRDYQQQGLSWLQFLRTHHLGGVLADDMGLGKTVQTLAHILLEKQQGRLDRPALVVAPTSLMVNWRREAQQFAPELRVLLLHGPKRRAHFAAIPGHDLVLTSYPLLARDHRLLQMHGFHLLVLDEAQNIKNPKAQASKVVRELNARHRLCLTGTPLENHLGELWSLFDFLLPGLLGSDKQFRQSLRNPIEKQGDEAAAKQLALRLRPFMLRRTKQEVVRELPPKTEILRSVELAGDQRDLYETIRLAMHARVRDAVAEQGWARSQIMVLDALLKLRQVCCDPRLVKLEDARKVKHSAKLELLMELLPEMVEEGRRILLFSQFTGMLKLIEEAVREAGLDYVKLTGQTRDRARPVDRFQTGEVPLFLISLKAGGTGLNLTAADTVIHYDPWWNPAVERQATDRAHRIGQQNPVFVYKLITEGTVEEKIQHLQQHKQALADSLFVQGDQSAAGWSEEELEMLFGALT